MPSPLEAIGRTMFCEKIVVLAETRSVEQADKRPLNAEADG